MKTFRVVVWLAIAVLGGYLAWHTVGWTIRGGAVSSTGTAAIGGPFEAVRSDGSKITRADMLGRPHLVFFGFTFCPDVCPTTLYEAGQWLNALGEDGDKVDVYFVSVDPERDTPQVLGEYLSAFDKRITGITGTPEQVQKIAKNWRVFVEKKSTGDGPEDYTVNHTATTYLMDAEGHFQRSIAYGPPHTAWSDTPPYRM